MSFGSGGSAIDVLAGPREEFFARIAAADERDAEHLHDMHDNHFVKEDALNGQLMLTTSATVLAGLLGAALIFMGGCAFTTPQAAVGFGIPDTPADDPAFRPGFA